MSAFKGANYAGHTRDGLPLSLLSSVGKDCGGMGLTVVLLHVSNMLMRFSLQGAQETARSPWWPVLSQPAAFPAAASDPARLLLACVNAGLATWGMTAASVLRATSGELRILPTPQTQ